jgi:hypothetical protein
MFSFLRFRKPSSLAKTLALLVPFKPADIDGFIKREFSGENALRKWANVFMVAGLLTLISVTTNLGGFWNKESFWAMWLILFIAGLLLCFGSIMLKMKDKERVDYDRRIIFVLCLFGIGIWVYQIIANGFSVIWPSLVADVLALFGFGFLAVKNKFTLYGLIMLVLSFIISAGYLLK